VPTPLRAVASTTGAAMGKDASRSTIKPSE